MKPRKINRWPQLPVLPCDPGLGCTYPNCMCNVERIFSTDGKKLTKMQILGLLIMILSGTFCVLMIYVITVYFQEIKQMANNVWSVILINKFAGGFTMLAILTIVYFVIVGYSKRENF